MERPSTTDELAAEIRNAAWLVRHYQRGARSGVSRLQRAQAIQRLGLTVRHAFGVSDNFEALLAALIDALAPADHEPPF